jgi:hypothetical protein
VVPGNFPFFDVPAFSQFAGIAQLVERNLAKVEVASSNLVSRSKHLKNPGGFSQKMGSLSFPFVSVTIVFWRDSKAVMQRIANPSSPVRLWVAPPKNHAPEEFASGAFFYGRIQLPPGQRSWG